MKYTKRQLGKYKLIEFKKRESREYKLEDYRRLINSANNMLKYDRKYITNKMVEIISVYNSI